MHSPTSPQLAEALCVLHLLLHLVVFNFSLLMPFWPPHLYTERHIGCCCHLCLSCQMCSVSSLTAGHFLPHMPIELRPSPFSHRHTQWNYSVHCLSSPPCGMLQGPLKSDLHHRHLACAVLTEFPLVPLCSHLIIGPLCCPPLFLKSPWLASVFS